MTTADDRMTSHWWWRPGWSVGRAVYTWYVTFDGDSAMAKAESTEWCDELRCA